MAGPSGGTLGKVLGNPVGEAAAFAGGLAIHPVLRPVLQELTNLTWDEFRSLPVEAVLVAEAVAHGHIDQATGAKEAGLSGISTDRFDKLVTFAKVGPGVASAFELWRRNIIDDAGFERALTRAGIEAEWITALKQVKERLLDPAVIAVAIQRGVMNAPFDLPYNPNVPVGKITPFPVSPLDAAAEAAGHGWTIERLRVETALVGLPMALDRAARAEFRGVIDHNDFLRAVLEGNARGEWAEAELEVAREILSAHDWVELHLRGYITQEQMYAGTALHGMSEADSDRLYQVMGRPLPVRAITTGLARGGKFNPIPGELTDPYEASVHEANIRPSFYDLAIANRYTLPSAFVIRALLKDGAIDAATGEELFLQSGWRPDLAKLVATHYAVAGVAAGPVKLTTEDKAAVRTIGKSYTLGRMDRLTAEAELVKLGLTSAEWDEKFVAWDVTRESTLKQLTDAQVKKAIASGRYSLPEAVAILEGRGFTLDDATTFLTE